MNLKGNSQFIVPEGQSEKRGRLELMFFTIGGSVIAGLLPLKIESLFIYFL